MSECDGCRRLRSEMEELRAAVDLVKAGGHIRTNTHRFGVGGGAVRLEFVQSTQGLLVDPDTLEVYLPSHPYFTARSDADGTQLLYSEDGVTERLFDSLVFDLDLDGDIDGANTEYTPRDADGRAVRLSEAVISLGGVVKYSTLDFTLEDGASGITMLTAPITSTTVGGKRDFRVVIGRRAVRT